MWGAKVQVVHYEYLSIQWKQDDVEDRRNNGIHGISPIAPPKENYSQVYDT